MKQVVINGGLNYSGLLTPKWIIEYLKRKNINAYVYIINPVSLTEFQYEKQDPNELDSNEEVYFESYLTIDKDIITTEEYENLSDEYFICKSELFKDREDPILIEIAKEINNEEMIKIVEIPDDVSYHVVDVGFEEHIVENHRIWK